MIGSGLVKVIHMKSSFNNLTSKVIQAKLNYITISGFIDIIYTDNILLPTLWQFEDIWSILSTSS